MAGLILSGKKRRHLETGKTMPSISFAKTWQAQLVQNQLMLLSIRLPLLAP